MKNKIYSCEHCKVITDSTLNKPGWIRFNIKKGSHVISTHPRAYPDKIEREVSLGTGRKDFCSLDCFQQWATKTYTYKSGV